MGYSLLVCKWYNSKVYHSKRKIFRAENNIGLRSVRRQAVNSDIWDLTMKMDARPQRFEGRRFRTTGFGLESSVHVNTSNLATTVPKLNANLSSS